MNDNMATMWTYVILLCLPFGGLCCNSGWYNYMGSCYRASQNRYTALMAKRFCQVSGARLAYVNSTDILQFLNTIPNFNGIHDYWIKEGSFISQEATTTSTVTNSTEDDHMNHDGIHDHSDHNHHENYSSRLNNMPDLCPYAKILKIDFEYCTEKKFFICETFVPENPDICPTGFDYYGTHCYRPVTSVQVIYNDAEKLCEMQKGKLAVLETEDKEWEAKSALLGKNQTFLVAARKYDNVLKWNNEIIFDPLHDMFANYSEGDCVAFSSDPEHPLIFTWVHVKCGEKHNFLCEADSLTAVSTEPPTTVVPTTTEQPLQCPHGYNWKSDLISGHCFWETTYETERLNWFQAREFCKLYGGDLASYDNEKQETIGLGGARGHFRGLWIGLKRDENSVFHWVDGSTLSYFNWEHDEPNINSTSKFCVTHSSGSSKWALDYCGARRWFICKAPRVRNPVMPVVPTHQKPRCTIQSVSAYRTDWFEYEGECYLVHDTNKYTWDTARVFCQDNGAHMASIHSFEETNFILGIISIYPVSDFWIGLSAHGLHSSYEWSDSSPLDFIYWSDNRSEAKDFNTCIKFNKRDGSWDFDNCNRLQGVICKRGVNSSYVFSTTEPTAVMPGNCENGWYTFGNKCYKYFGSLWSQRLSWAAAKTECNNLGATLASVHNQDEQDFLTDIVLEAYTHLWIGLRAMEGGAIFHWSDNTRMDYTNWKADEPEFHYDSVEMFLDSRPPELCVGMEYSETDMGRWNDVLCTDKKGYICQKMKDPTNTEPYQDPFLCQNITGWYRLGNSCYGFFEQHNKTWLEAQGDCKKYGANLITYRNVAVSIFVKRKLQKKSHFWIGLRETAQNKYEYVTGQPLFYTSWMRRQPQAASATFDNCVATTSDGEWLVKSCKEKLPYICRATQDTEPEPKIELDRSHMCRNLSGDWRDFGGDYCYMIEPGMRLSWVDAMHYCFRHGGYLASFHSNDDIQKILGERLFDAKMLYNSVHIGLGRKKDATYSWVDNSPYDFTNWEEEQPDPTDKECVEMKINSGKWRSVDCDDSFRAFLCSAPKASLQHHAKEILPFNSTLEKEYISAKLTAGGILGIVICILVILAIIGMTIYYLRPEKQVQPRLLETDNL